MARPRGIALLAPALGGTPAAPRAAGLRAGGGRARTRRGGRGEAGGGELVAQVQGARDVADLALLVEPDERRADAGAPGAPRAPDPVDVALAVLGRVEVDDVRDPVDVEPSR